MSYSDIDEEKRLNIAKLYWGEDTVKEIHSILEGICRSPLNDDDLDTEDDRVYVEVKRGWFGIIDHRFYCPFTLVGPFLTKDDAIQHTQEHLYKIVSKISTQEEVVDRILQQTDYDIINYVKFGAGIFLLSDAIYNKNEISIVRPNHDEEDTL